MILGQPNFQRMVFSKSNFPEITSRHSRGFTLLIKGFGWFFSVLIILCAAIMVILVFKERAITSGFEILLLALGLLLLLFFGRLIISSLLKGPDSKVTRIAVDKNGINYYHGSELVRRLNYDDLKPCPDGEKYDVFLTDIGEGSPYYLYVYFPDSISGKYRLKCPDLDSQTVITNGNQLKRHFVTGIMIFRPDLKIAPGVLDLYRLEKIQ